MHRRLQDRTLQVLQKWRRLLFYMHLYDLRHPLAGITTLFGTEDIRASPCFLTFLKRHKKKSNQSVINFENEILVEELRSEPLGVPFGRSLTLTPKGYVFREGYDEEMTK